VARLKLSNRLEHWLLVLALALGAGLVSHQDLLWRWDNLAYDAQLSFWSRDLAGDIVIVGIDDQSLRDIGQWPWSRAVHARLVDAIDRESPRAIGLDIIFAEPDRLDPQADRQLADAIGRSGKVVLPVYLSRESLNGLPVEALPLPELASSAAGLGHVHLETGQDGIARRVFLREGIGKPHWLHFSLEMLKLANGESASADPSDSTGQASYSAMQWSRESPVLIPYAGPAGHFPRIGASRGLSGEYPTDLFRDKIVLVGATAEGLGDALPTPVSGASGVMPGAEIIANMVDALQRDISIREAPVVLRLALTVLLAALPVLLYPYINPSRSLLLLGGSMLASLALIACLLWLAGIWVPASSLLLFQLLSYPLWSWRRLVLAMRHLNHELDALFERQRSLELTREPNLPSELQFLEEYLPLAGWVIFDPQGRRLSHSGISPPRPQKRVATGQWMRQDDQYWGMVDHLGLTCLLGLQMQQGVTLERRQLRQMDSLLKPVSDSLPATPYLEDVLQTRINLVQKMSREYQSLHRIIDDSLAGMSDGVLICNQAGQVLFSNQRAGWYLKHDDDAVLEGLPINHILQEVQPHNQDGWSALFQQVLFQHQRAICEARHASGRDLMVQISPLPGEAQPLPGMIVNLSDTSRLKASERRRSEVLNFLSHDLRAPLASMLAIVELAQARNSVEALRDSLSGIEHNTRRILHFAEQFLQLARATTDAQIEFHDTDFVSIVYNVSDQMWASAAQRNIHIELRLDQDEIWTRLEPDLVERALVNLLSNAIKHSPRNETIVLSVHLVDGMIQCCVRDHGQGIDADELPNLFNLYQRTRGSSREGIAGTGLGLAFVEAVAKRHDGEALVASKPGEGATFCLRLPQLETITPA